MAIFTIPEEYESGLARLLTLSDESVQGLLDALEGVTPSIRYRSIAEKVAAKTSIPSDDLEDIFEVLFSLNIIRTGAEVPTDIFVDDICDAVKESELELIKAVAGTCEKYKPNLTKLLESKTLENSSKAGMLMREQGRMYCSARVLSDVRPIFGESAEAAPMGAMIIHSLKITCHKGDKLEDFFVAMNTADVQKLRELLDRADTKAASLKTFIGTSSVPYVDAE